MQYNIQSIVFPTEEKHQQCRELFYRGDSAYLDRERKVFHMGHAQKCDFVTYLNACSYRKWKEYTNAGKVTVTLELQGEMEICYVGFHIDVITVTRKEFAIRKYDFSQKTEIKFEFPENDEQMLGFEITAVGDSTFYGGFYSVEVDEACINDVTLCIGTTTMKKEAFIKKNVELLKEEILAGDPEMAEHFYVHVVDNGRTLSERDIYGDHVFLHPNSNAGGAGGFARGMIESMNQNPAATHVLLMDDDVLMLPESLRRTYHLLKLMKKEHQNDFISGAMLYYEEPYRQHEDIGTVTKDCFFVSLKEKFDHREIESNLKNESHYLRQKNAYAGWWYCCIPVPVIEKYGLPLPIFIRCDDMEYSLRCHANIITMNGICVWHMGFVTKYNAAFDKYQQCRNLLIDKACSDIMKNVDVDNFVRKSFRMELLKFNYDAAELILRGFRDFLKGPEFLYEDRGEAIVKENVKLNDQMHPLDELEGGDILNVFDCYADPPRSFKDKWLFRLTYNGQFFCPGFLEKKEIETIAFDHTYQPGRMAMRSRVLAVNPFNKTGIVREKDKERFRKLWMKFHSYWTYYKKHRNEIIQRYRNDMQHITSEDFWREYLKIK